MRAKIMSMMSNLHLMRDNYSPFCHFLFQKWLTAPQTNHHPCFEMIIFIEILSHQVKSWKHSRTWRETSHQNLAVLTSLDEGRDPWMAITDKLHIMLKDTVTNLNKQREIAFFSYLKNLCLYLSKFPSDELTSHIITKLYDRVDQRIIPSTYRLHRRLSNYFHSFCADIHPQTDRLHHHHLYWSWQHLRQRKEGFCVLQQRICKRLPR